MEIDEYKPTIGLEIHCELKTNSKMFCSCKNDANQKEPNKNICPICTGHPGTLPTINQEAVKKVIKAGLALNCEIAHDSKFDRKNYFYPDLVKGYQISQYDQPLCQNGYIVIDGNKIRIKRIHLEEDTGRIQHDKDSSLIDYNRAGMPLMELVTEPDIFNGPLAKKFGQELQLIFRYLGISDADMEKGQMRVEVNISLSKTNELGAKVEVKNISSFNFVAMAIDYEIARQAEILDRGEKIVQETRGWDSIKGITVSQRIKEGESDYRYFPEPDLPPLKITQEEIQEIESQIPELPQAKRTRFAAEYNLTDKEIEVFVIDQQMSEYFEKICSELGTWAQDEKIEQDYLKLVKLAANYLLTDYRGIYIAKGTDDKDYPITPENFAELVKMIYKGEISSKIAKIVLLEMFETKGDPSTIIKEKGLEQISDSSQIESIARIVVEKNPKAVADYKKGQVNSAQFLVGQLMKESKGAASPEIAREIILKILQEQ